MMEGLSNKHKYILYGTGGEAERFLFQNPNILPDIAFCIDKKNREKFYDLNVCQIDDVNVRDYIGTHCIIVAAGNEDIFLEIKHILCNYGLKEWRNFIWSKTVGRKVVLINANCHGAAIQKYLEQSARFCNEYMVYPIPEIQLNTEGEISDDLLKNTDVYIHQDIRAENPMGYKLSDEYVRAHLSQYVIDICIPNFVGMAKWMYPNLGNLDRTMPSMKGPINILFRDSVLDEAVLVCNSFHEIKNFWGNYKYEASKMDNDFTTCMDKLKRREENWDIKIFDYIMSNYRRIPCFTDASHPSKYVMREVGRQVADLIGLDDVCDKQYESQLGLMAPIMDCILKNFGLSFDVPREVRYEYLGKRTVEEPDDYIKAYCWWYHGKAYADC